MVLHIWRKTTLIAHCGRHALVVEEGLQGVKDLGPIAQGLLKTWGPHRDDHELLQVEIVVGVCAAIDHIHHGNRKRHGATAAKVSVEGQAGLLGCRTGRRHGDCQHGIGPQTRFVLGAIEVDEGAVDKGLLGGV